MLRSRLFKATALMVVLGLCLLYLPLDNGAAFGFDRTPEIRQTGERPVIDLARVPDEAIEEGKLYIKFKPGAVQTIESLGLKYSDKGIVITGIKDIDLLNEKYGVTQFEPMFSSLYETNGRSSEYVDRHRAWGLHLWYELRVNVTHDIRKVVKDYNSLKDIEIAEPEFKKEIHRTPDVKDSINYYVISGGEITTPPYETHILWTPDDPLFILQWHYDNYGQWEGTPGADIDLVRAWDLEKGNTDVIVAIIDSGIQYDHPDLAANMWGGIGWNFVYNSDAIIPNPHGTHVAGTVAAVSNNDEGVAGIAGGSGLGDGVRLMSCQVFVEGVDAGGFHLAPVYAADNGAAISQNSWGYTWPNVYEHAILDAIDYFNANGGGTVLDGGITIFSAGNSNCNQERYPGYYSGAISVAATGNQDRKSFYSTYGSWVDISAPGGEMHIDIYRGVVSTYTNDNYAIMMGTSMASPHVSGAAALIISRMPSTLTAPEVAGILKETADDHHAVNHFFAGKLGTGRLNAYNALTSAITGIRNPVNFKASSTSETRIDLSWQKNNKEEDVMVVWSADGTFGTPVNGTSYSEGDVIPGGGTVLYSGSATSYSHMGLSEGTTYYYRAFSYTATDQYSVGNSTLAFTLLSPISAFPWTETFEEDSSTRNYWTQYQVDGYRMWEYATDSTGGMITSAQEGELLARFTSTQEGGTTRLITPMLDLSAYSGFGELSFWYAQEPWFGDQNELKIYYRSTPVSPWARIFHSTKSLETWTHQLVTLPDPSPYYQLAFEGIDNWGRSTVIDNVTVMPLTGKIYWEDTSNGDRIVWFMAEDGATRNSFAFLNPKTVPTRYRIAVAADLTGDGNTEILWEDTINGDRIVWFVTPCGSRYDYAYLDPSPVPTLYRIAAAADLTGDGQAEIIWENTRNGDRIVWFMEADGVTRESFAYLDPSPVPTRYRIAAAADLTGNGQAEIIWEDTRNGDRIVWFMEADGVTLDSSFYLDPSPVPIQYRIAGAADLTGNGQAEIIWEDTVNGDRIVWFMEADGYTRSSFAYLDPSPVPTRYRIAGVIN